MPPPCEVVACYDHDVWAFTQGLAWHAPSATLFESTGRYGDSSLRRWALQPAPVGRAPGIMQSCGRVALDGKLFGEGIGIAPLDGADCLFQFTWRERVVLRTRIEPAALTPLEPLPFTGDAWGCTGGGEGLWLSDGSATLRLLDAATLQVRRTLPVWQSMPGGVRRPVEQLNDLTWVAAAGRPYLIANVFRTHHLVRICPASGEVLDVLNLRGLLPLRQCMRAWLRRRPPLMNGLAWRAETGTLLLTGKHWGRLYELRLPPLPR